MRKLVMAVFLVAVLVSCKKASGNDEGIVFWTPSSPPTQTERIVVWTATPLSTYTPIVKEVTSTPNPEYLCVTADEAVHLRPSADLTGYPIAPLPKGTRLTDLGGRENGFAFVTDGEQQGWVKLDFVKLCE